MATPLQHEQQGARKRRAYNSEEDALPDYPQVRRLLQIFDLLAQSGPQSAEELAAKTGVKYRTMAKFMSKAQEYGWPIYVRKDNASATTLWALDHEKMCSRWEPKKKKKP